MRENHFIRDVFSVTLRLCVSPSSAFRRCDGMRNLRRRQYAIPFILLIHIAGCGRGEPDPERQQYKEGFLNVMEKRAILTNDKELREFYESEEFQEISERFLSRVFGIDGFFVLMNAKKCKACLIKDLSNGTRDLSDAGSHAPGREQFAIVGPVMELDPVRIGKIRATILDTTRYFHASDMNETYRIMLNFESATGNFYVMLDTDGDNGAMGFLVRMQGLPIKSLGEAYFCPPFAEHNHLCDLIQELFPKKS